jgi:histidyl-tRNA synthetase
MAIKYKAPRGTSDVLYPESEKIERLVGLASDILSLHGYRRINTPILESTDLFVRSIGAHTDIVTKEMYTFEDQGGESLTLRPEATAPVLRAYLELGLASKGLPQKLFYYGPMFRRERPQAGRFRQFQQIGAEFIGSDDPFADAEIIAVNDIFFRRLGLGRYHLAVNSVGCRECRPGYVETLSAYLGAVADSLCEQCRRRSVENPLRVFDCKEEGCQAAIDAAPVIGDHLCPGCRSHFDAVLAHLDRLGISCAIDDRLVRGLDYYTRTTFEFQFDMLGAQNAVCGGGRYDYLVEELGGPPTPGVGYSLGMERLVIALEGESLDPFDLPRLQVFVAGTEGIDRAALLSLLTDLRGKGISADADFMGRSLKAQMKQADRLCARFAIICGGDEFEKGEVVLRDLDLSEQWTVRAEEAADRITGLQKGK